MPLLVLILISLAAGLLAAGVAWRYPRSGARSPEPVAEAVVQMAAEAGPLRAFLRRRRDPVAATGLALTVALAVIIVGGVVIGVLAYLVRSSRSGLDADSAAARWGFRHATPFTNHALDLITRLGDVYVVTMLAVVVALVETIRVRSRYVIPFLVVVTLGNYLATLAIKDLTDRARPTLNPIAASLGPSFPSGHSSTAAAFYAVVALLIGRSRGHVARTLLAAGAVAIAVAVACSRVLLDVHWVSDVVAGLFLGWACFALCAIAFGGRLVRFGATGERATDAAHPSKPGPTALEV